MKLAEYQRIRQAVIDAGYEYDIEWAEGVAAPEDCNEFALEAAYVICNSGMKAQIAWPIFERVREAIARGRLAGTVFGHKGKAAAIDHIWQNRLDLFAEYLAAPDKVAYLETLPWIGGITKWHLAKNFGLDVVKPDRHIVRLAEHYQCTPTVLCQRIADECGDRIGTVDLVLWRAANLGIIKTRELAEPSQPADG